MLIGSILGGLLTMGAFWAHSFIKKINGRVLFPFQGIVFTVVFLLIAGLAMYFTMNV